MRVPTLSFEIVLRLGKTRPKSRNNHGIVNLDLRYDSESLS